MSTPKISGGGVRRLDELPQASDSEAPHEDKRATVTAREAPRLPHRAVTVHVRHHDKEIDALYEGFQRARASPCKIASMALERVTELLHCRTIVGTDAVEAADDTDMHEWAPCSGNAANARGDDRLSRIIDSAFVSRGALHPQCWGAITGRWLI
jgi:hypothetical protein